MELVQVRTGGGLQNVCSANNALSIIDPREMATDNATLILSGHTLLYSGGHTSDRINHTPDHLSRKRSRRCSFMRNAVALE